MTNSMHTKIRARLSSESGETIAETLVSVLVSSLALLLLATAIASAVNIVSLSRNRMDARYEAESAMVLASEETSLKKGQYTTDVLIATPSAVGSDTSRNLLFYQSGDDDVYLYKREE
ncbi:MAG: hypothetical protein Q4A07_00880 [Coriobacteriales bacterium]|nr:hypothetical protein [Coriobacteriales bacterium]